ncbi:phosphatidylethanolamine N-methyltransferase, partial [Tulasnella sp. 419]
AHRQCGRVQDMANSNARVLDCVPSQNGSDCTLTREQPDGLENEKTSLDNIHNHANHSCISIMDSFSSHHLSSEVLLASILHPSTLDRRAIARWAQEHLRLGIACHKSDGELIEITSSLLPNVIWENIMKEGTPTSFEKLCTSIAKMPTNDLQSGYISDAAELGLLSQLKAGLEEMLQKVENFEPSSPNPSNVSQISPSLTSPTVGNESGLLLGGDSDRSRTVAAGSSVAAASPVSPNEDPFIPGPEEYSMVVVTDNHSGLGKPRFHMGEPISVKWCAPSSHSKKDWLGLYPIGANRSSSVTDVNSLERWIPIHDEDWLGDIPLSGSPKQRRFNNDGEVVFKGDRLPWQTGLYEIRYHHDGEFTVLASVGPIEIYVQKPTTMDDTSIHAVLVKNLWLCLDGDSSLLPPSSPHYTTVRNHNGTVLPTTFRCNQAQQAKRICASIKEIFDLEYTPEKILSVANIPALVKEILSSIKTATPSARPQNILC